MATVVQVPTVVTITSNAVTSTVVREHTIISVSAPGPQGVKGDTGDMGPPGGTGFEFIQASPSATWVIDHNLGRKVHVSLFDSLGRVVYSDVEHSSVDQATVTYPSPVTGSAVLS